MAVIECFSISRIMLSDDPPSYFIRKRGSLTSLGGCTILKCYVMT